MRGIVSTDGQHAWVYAQQVILRTSDGGVTWAVHTFDEDAYIMALTFVDARIGWGVDSSRGLIYSTDGGATWRVQDAGIEGEHVVFLDAQTGWILGYDRLWRTTDGGQSWEEHAASQDWRAAYWVDSQHGWAVGALGDDGRRATIAHTGDGGLTWQVQDSHIETPALAFTATAHLNALLAQPNPPTEALLGLLLQAPCQFRAEREWMAAALENLGWDGTGWNRPLTSTNGLIAAIHRLETDLDEDRQDEILVYGNAGEVLLGILDWDGHQWQVALLAYREWQYVPEEGIQVRVDDWNADGHPEILAETMVCGHTGRFRRAELVRCEHLQCRSIWSDDVGFVGGGFLRNRHFSMWESNGYHWIDWDGDSSLDIQAWHYGIVRSVTTDQLGQRIPGTLEARVLTTTQVVYCWDGAQYTPTAETVLEAGYALDTQSLTQTLDLDGNGTMERVVSRWEASYEGLQQILTVYTRSEPGGWQPLQAFTATMVYPPAGVLLQDADGDGSPEVVVCTNPAFADLTLDTWPTRAPPLCTTYDWDSTRRIFVAQGGPTISPSSPFQVNPSNGWCWQEMLGLVNSLNDVFFLDARTGWAVGEQGTMLHTEDGGDTWQRQASPVSADLARVVFTSANNGWVTGRDGGRNVLLHTRDGGHTWEERHILSQQDETYSFSTDMAWADALNGWVTIDLRVFHTADGGQSWQEQSLPLGKDDWPRSITCVDDRHAWIAAEGDILRTTDGGQTWVSHTISSANDGLYVTSLSFLDASTGLAIGDNSPVMRTVDGGQTWQVQHEALSREQQTILFSCELAGCWLGKVCIGPEKRVPTLGSATAWLVDDEARLWQTTDGGVTWAAREAIPSIQPVVTFVDAQHGWAVGGWRWRGERATIAHTDDGGASWQIQDAHIKMPPIAYTSTALLSAYLAQREPPLEALLLLLLPGPCGYDETYRWVATALHNLGWKRDRWGAPPIAKSVLLPAVHRLDVDLDGDGSQEIALYGGSEELFAAVLDWDGSHWQVAWSDFVGSRYDGDIQLRADDLNADGRPELVIEMLRHPSGGSGYRHQSYEMSVVQCQHLRCYSLWEQALGNIERVAAMRPWYEWSGSSLRFVERGQGRYPDIELEQYGVGFDQFLPPIPASEPLLDGTWSAYVLTSTRAVYQWNGARYAPADPIQIQPGRALDTRPITETIDLDGDGKLERAVYGWTADFGGLWQTLSIYSRDDHDDRSYHEPDHDNWHTTQVFTAAFTGMPTAGISLQDVDGDGRSEVVQCTTSFTLSVQLGVNGWPFMQPVCTVYHWNPATRGFEPRAMPSSSRP